METILMRELEREEGMLHRLSIVKGQEHMLLPFIKCLVTAKTLSYLTNKIMNNKLATSINELKERRNSYRIVLVIKQRLVLF